MKSRIMNTAGVAAVLLLTTALHAETRIVVERYGSESASMEFKLKDVPVPSRNDAATKARFTLVDGRRDANGGDLDKLHDGMVPTEDDQPGENFFFNAGTAGGRLLVDLGAVIDIKQINTYSWHPGSRGPQVYTLYAGSGTVPGFEPQPKSGTDPQQCGWARIAQVDTRPRSGPDGGQYGVTIRDAADGIVGRYRYLLFEIARTERQDGFGNTFYSEIDVVDPNTPALAAVPAIAPAGEVRREVVETEGGVHQITIDTTEAPDLTDWAHQDLAPVIRQWYPRLIKLLPSEGYEAPRQVSITFSTRMQGVAATGGTRIRCAAGWFRRNLQGEAKGAVVHELAHVVQNYGLARRSNPEATRTPGWLVEGICDYLRWYLYEPQTRGAEITARNLARARYDGNYRISANFLNWVTQTYCRDIVQRLNAAARQGKYHDGLWKTATGHTLQELGDEWKAALEKKVAAEAAASEVSTNPPRP
ncbi:MAG: basic secretory family protein [Planctomycetes bacterium]|jgi:hypothetical protein|nr:basic secretory family protein [Planctomycetota bacterium]